MNYINLEEEIEALESIYGKSSHIEYKDKLPLAGLSFENKERILKFYSDISDGILEIKITIPSGYLKDDSACYISSWYFDINYLTLNGELPISRNITIDSKAFKQLKELIELRVSRKESVLFEIINNLISYTENKIICTKHQTETKFNKDSEHNNELNNATFDEQIFEITHGEPIVDRKSVFQAHACRVNNLDEVQKVIKYLLSNPKIAKATHNMWSYRLCKNKNEIQKESSFPIGYNIITQDHDSDGETAAGSRLQHLLTVLDAKNVFVMVTRWYGGIQLGPDRFKHINNAARQTLEKSGLISLNTISRNTNGKSKKQKV